MGREGLWKAVGIFFSHADLAEQRDLVSHHFFASSDHFRSDFLLRS